MTLLKSNTWPSAQQIRKVNSYPKEILNAAKEHIGLPLHKEMDEEESYYNPNTQSFLSFLEGVMFHKDLIEKATIEVPVQVNNPNELTEAQIQSSRLFELLVSRGVLKTDRDYEIAKKTLFEQTGVKYDL